MDGFVFGIGILFVMWLLGRWMGKKTRTVKEESRIQLIERSPEAVAKMLLASLNAYKINTQLMNRLPPKFSSRYLNESFLALASAQWLAIDKEVLRLDIRGPLINGYRKKCPAELQERFEAYKQAFETQNDITSVFAGFLGLEGHEKISVDLREFNTQFMHILFSTRRELKILNLST